MAEEKKKSLFIQEMERRANDLLRVYNPTGYDYVIKWDKRGGTKLFRVPAKSEAVHVRYIAEKYVREMFEKIITEKADSAILKENTARIAKGMAEMRKWDEQLRFESKFYNPSDEEAKALISILFVGVESEFGIDQEAEEEEEQQNVDRPVFDRIMEGMKDKKAEDKSVTLNTAPVIPNNTVEENTIPKPKKKEYKCDFPGCNFVAKVPVALVGHKRSHRPQEDTEEQKKKAVVQVSE